MYSYPHEMKTVQVNFMFKYFLPRLRDVFVPITLPFKRTFVFYPFFRSSFEGVSSRDSLIVRLQYVQLKGSTINIRERNLQDVYTQLISWKGVM